jgi:GNAT superfamily N-acetyltransferase
MSQVYPVNIRAAIAEDMPAVYALIRELAIYERAEQEHSCSLDQLITDGFGPKPLFECLVAETAEEGILGMALFYTKYSTWKGACLYLEDLVVQEAARGRGIGRELLEALMCVARDRQVGRLEWQVLDWNEPAIGFYERMGAVLDPEWINCKLTFEQLQEFRPEKR